ncbi:MAG: MFS transporter [Pseudomonadales bacterium]|jgi:MFS family permease|nr:MFS transporter [Pseudomonadales bacterium]
MNAPVPSTKQELLANWQILAVAFMLVFFSFGVPNFSLPFMYKPAMDEFGWSNAQVNLLSTSKFLVGAAAALGMGILIDKIGGKLSVLIGALCGGIAMALFLLASNLPVYYLAGAVLGLSASSIVAAMKVVVSRLFEINQGLAIGIVLSATSLGQTLMPLVWGPALDAGYNWRHIAGVLSLGSLLISTPLWIFFMSRNGATQNIINAASGRSASDTTMWDHFKVISKERGFWLVAIGVFLVSAVDQAMTQNHVTFLRTDKGLPVLIVSSATSLAGFLAVIAKPLAGWLYDRYSISAVKFFYFLLALSVVMALLVVGITPLQNGLGYWEYVKLLPMATVITVLLYLSVQALAHGALIVEVPVLTKHYLGTRNLGMTIGLLSVAVNLGFAAGPPVLGYFVDIYHNYTNGLLVYAAVAFVGFVMLLPIKPRFWVPPSQRRKQEQEAGASPMQPASA